MLYSLARGAYGFEGRWPYGNSGDASRLFLADIMRPALPHVADVLAIPAAPDTAPLTAPKVADAAPIFVVIPAAESKKPIYLSPLASIYLTKLST
jgi:hypothetical protein